MCVLVCKREVVTSRGKVETLLKVESLPDYHLYLWNMTTERIIPHTAQMINLFVVESVFLIIVLQILDMQ